MIDSDRRTLQISSQIEPLTADRYASIAHRRDSRFSRESLARHLALNPGLSFFDISTGQCIIGGYWRNRPQIASLIELSDGAAQQHLFGRFQASVRKIGCELIVADMSFQARDIARWSWADFGEIDSIMEFQKSGTDFPSIDGPSIHVRRYQPDDLHALIGLERESFPWIWWNSVADLIAYSESKNSEIWLIDDSVGGIAGYVGITIRDRHGHLDRLAVAPSARMRGFGAELVKWALTRFTEHRVRQISLTTQFDNIRSQNLYRRFGFRATPFAITIHGRWLGRPRDRTP